MTGLSWAASVSSNWANAAAWTPGGGPPTSATVATIGATGSNYSVSVDSGDAASSLALSSANATVNIHSPSGALTIAGALTQSAGTMNVGTSASPNGTLTVGGGDKLSGGTLNVNEGGLFSLTGTLLETAGHLNLNAGGTLSGGVIDATGGAINFNGGTLSGVAFDGPLNLTANGASVHLANNAMVVGSAGSGPGTINVTGKGAILYVDNTQTVSSVMINIGASAGSATFGLYHVFTSLPTSETLTLASTTVVDFKGYGTLTSGNFGGDGIVNYGLIEQTAGLTSAITGSAFTNDGTLTASDAKGVFAIDTNTFVNSANINVSNGDQLVLASFNSITLSATSAISVGARSTLKIGQSFGSTTWSNLGAITLATNSTLDLGGEFTLSEVGTITNNGGAVYVTGTLNNTGQTLSGTGALGVVDLNGGTVLGGIVESTGVKFASGGASSVSTSTLNDVTFYGPLNLTGQNQSVALTGGTTIVGSSGTGPGVVNVSGLDAQLDFAGTQTVSNLTLNITGGNGPASLGFQDFNGSSIITLASSATLDFDGSGNVAAGFNPGDSLVNQGLIEQTKTGSAQISGISFTNTSTGAINAAAAGGEFSISATTFVNSGTIDVSNGDQLTLADSNIPGGSTTLSATSKISVGAKSTLVIGASGSLGPQGGGSFSNLGSITLASGAALDLGSGAFTVANLGSITNTGGAIDITGTLNNAGQTINGSGGLGALTLDGGTVSGGIVTSTGLVFASGGNGVFFPGTLSGVTFYGPLNLTGQNQAVDITGGTTIVGSTGTVPGVVNLTGNYDELSFGGTQTISNLTVNIGGQNPNAIPGIGMEDINGAPTTLTLANSSTINFVAYGILNAGFNFNDSFLNSGLIEQTKAGNANISGASFTNAGTISAVAAGGYLSINPTTFVNNGTIDIANGDQVNIASGNNPNSSTTLSATSEISIGVGSSLVIGNSNIPGNPNPNPSGTFSNQGLITLASGAALDLGGAFTLASIGSVTNTGGTINIVGTLNNAGRTLNGSGGLGPLTLDQGTIQGGIVTTSGLDFGSGFSAINPSTLSGVTFEGPLDLTGQNLDLALTGGTTITGSTGTGPGLADVIGPNDQLEFAGSQTVSNLTINLGSSFSNSQIFNDDYNGAGQTLTLAASTVIDFVGSGTLNAGNFPGDSIVNQGLIDQTSAEGSAQLQGNGFTNAVTGTLDADGYGGNFQVNSSTFTNAGTIEVANGSFLNINSQTNFTNFSSGTLTGGAYDIAGGQIQISTGNMISTLAASVTLSGGGSSFDTFNQPTNANTSLDASLTTIASTGALSLLDFRNWTTSGAAITDNGLITLGGGAINATATSASLTVGVGGQLDGYGGVTANSLTNSGTIAASGGALQLNSGVTGAGTLQVDAGAELDANAAVASTQAVSFAGVGGTLGLFSPNSFAATISGFAAGDTFLTSAAFVNFMENVGGTSGTLTLSSGGVTDQITLNGVYSNSLFTHSTSGAITTIGYT
jgi:hypothetical protein